MKNRRLPFYVCLLAGAACVLFFAEAYPKVSDWDVGCCYVK